MFSAKLSNANSTDQRYTLASEIAQQLRVAPINYEGDMVPLAVVEACFGSEGLQSVKSGCKVVGGAVALSEVMHYLDGSLSIEPTIRPIASDNVTWLSQQTL